MAVPLRCAQRSPLPFALPIPAEAALLLLPSSGVLDLDGVGGDDQEMELSAQLWLGGHCLCHWLWQLSGAQLLPGATPRRSSVCAAEPGSVGPLEGTWGREQGWWPEGMGMLRPYPKPWCGAELGQGLTRSKTLVVAFS